MYEMQCRKLKKCVVWKKLCVCPHFKLRKPKIITLEKKANGGQKCSRWKRVHRYNQERKGKMRKDKMVVSGKAWEWMVTEAALMCLFWIPIHPSSVPAGCVIWQIWGLYEMRTRVSWLTVTFITCACSVRHCRRPIGYIPRPSFLLSHFHILYLYCSFKWYIEQLNQYTLTQNSYEKDFFFPIIWGNPNQNKKGFVFTLHCNCLLEENSNI